MRQAIAKNYAPRLSVVKETTAIEKSQAALADAAWNFAHTALWNDVQFSSKETENARQKIAAFLEGHNAEKAFVAFCERVLLARHYITKAPGRYIPLPSIWLDNNNKLGFAGTERWHDDIKTVRDSVPGYKTGIRALAEAMLELSRDPSANNYRYWRNYFIDHNAPGLLNLFQAAAIQQLYN